MKLAYGTYALPNMPLEEAIPMLGGMGYRGLEIALSAKHVGSLPEEMDAARRRRLRELLAANDMKLPAFMVTRGVYTEDPAQHQANLEHARVCAQLGRDLGIDGPPVLAQVAGGPKGEWDNIKGRMVELLLDYAKVAEEEDFIMAPEAHSRTAWYGTPSIKWLLDTVNHPRVGLHFDIVHTFLAGEAVADSVRELLPYTVHTHVTDARHLPDGSDTFALVGTGEMDIPAYVAAMDKYGWKDFITLEVSTLVWGVEGFDFTGAAQSCYEVMAKAFAEAKARLE
jgi:sugar phosphate isomerase/epimerase